MAVTAAWASALQPAQVQFTYLGTFKEETYRFGDSCYVTPHLAKTKWDWNVELRGDEVQIGCEGRLFRVGTYKENGVLYFDLTAAAKFLGASAEWRGDTYSVLGKVRGVTPTPTGLTIDATIKVKPKVYRMTNPDRVVIDVYGATGDLEDGAELPKWWRVGQYTPDTVRIVIEHPAAAGVKTQTYKESRELEIALPAALSQEPQAVTLVPQQGKPDPKLPQPIVLRSPQVGATTETGTSIFVPAGAGLSVGPSVRYVGLEEIQITLANGKFEVEKILDLDNRWIKKVTTTSDGANAVLIVQTSRPMAFTSSSKGAGFQINFIVPSGKGLAGRVIVVDAGHGGTDGGTSYAGVYEKNVTLGVAQELKKVLTEAGASVIMTRDEDSYPSLTDRARLANESNAALFVSIHVNSIPKVNGKSGSITFYHMQDPMDRLLAECIQEQIAEASKIPSLGCWSDRKIYQSGFKVLRDSNVPSVLIEMGFVNHSFDRAEMTKPGYKSSVAKAILRGIKTFLGDK